MLRPSLIRLAAVAVALGVAGCLGDSTGPRHGVPARLSLAPVFETQATLVLSISKVRITLTRTGGTALDTTVDFPPGADSLVLSFEVPINGSSETLSLNLAMTDAAGDTVFRGGPEPVTVSLGVSGTGTGIPVPIRYVGVGSNARSVKIGTKTASLFFRDSVQLTATALDSAGKPIAGTPIAWRSLDTTLARVPLDTSGKVIAGTARGVARIQAMLLTNQADTALVTVQPVPVAIGVVSGGGQSGAVGATLPQPVVVRVKAADSLGVAGVPVTLAVAGGGSVLKATDTTNANGDVSVTWTLGTTLGTQSLTAKLVAAPSVTTTATATGVAGAPKKLAFQVQPPNGAATVALSPAVQVVAQDTFGNTATSYTGNVTLALGTNPSGATLGGTLTVAAVAGVATFSNLTLNLTGTGYTLVVSASGLTSATSTAFNITGGVATQLVFTTEPPATDTAGAPFAAVVTARDAQGNAVTGFTGNVTLTITSGTGKAGATLHGTTSVAAVAGIATFSGLSIDSAGSNYTLTAAATGVTSATSTALTIGAGAAASLAFATQPPASSLSLAPFGFAVTAKDAVGNVATGFTGPVTVAIGTNPAGGALSGTLTHNAVAGVATFSGISIDNVGAGYTLVASASGLTSGTSAAFAITVAANVNAWINSAGGNWSQASNWSKGTVPTATDTVAIKQSGTYTVNLDVNAAFARLDVGAPAGTQTLSVGANTLTAGNGSFAANTVLNLSGTGTISGSGTLTVAGAFNWTGGNLSGGNGTVRVLAGGTLSIAPTSQVKFENYTLEVAGTGTWTGTAQVYGGQAILRVASGGTLNIQGDPSLAFNTYWAWAPTLNVVGTLNRTTSPNAAVIGGPLNDSGTVSVQSGTLQLGGGGASTGSFSVAAGDTLDFTGGTQNLAAASAISGAGMVKVNGGTLNVGGGFTANAMVVGGAAYFNGTAGPASSVTVASGTLGGSGLLTVSGPMSWTGGNLSGGNGTVRVLAGGTLSIAPTSQVKFENYTLEVAGTGTWTGTAQVYGGQAILRVASGGTLNIQGDPSLAFNTYWAWAPTLNVVGTLNRTTSPNAAVIGGPLNDSGTVSVQSGTLRLTAGGTSTGAYQVAAGDTLDFNNGTHTLTAASRISGAGVVNFSGGSVGIAGSYAVASPTLVSGGTASFNGTADSTGSLTVSAGTLNGSGLLTVGGAMNWTGGSLSGGNGTVRVLAGGTLSIAPTSQVKFENYTLEVAGTGTWTGTAQVYGGQAILRVASGGTLNIQGDPSLAFNTYWSWAPTLNVLGTLNRTISTGVAVIGGPLNDSGTVSVQSGTLQLGGGGNGNTVYTVSSGATLDLASGTWTAGTNMATTFAGNLQVSAGSLVLGGHTVTIGGNFTTASSGALQMTLAADSLDVTGNASFGGAAGTLSNGVIRVAGNFTQTGTANFAPGPNTSAQHVVLAGSAAQSLSFADATNSFFRRLVINKTGGGVVLSTNVRASFFRLQSSTAVSGATARLLADTVYGFSTTSSLTPLAVEITSVLGDSGGAGFSPDTTVFTGANQAISLNNTTFGNYAYKSIRVAQSAGTATFASSLTLTKDLVVSSGALNTNGRTISVTGNFSTQSTGVLTMALAADSLRVTGNVTFAGGSSAPSAGVITAGGNFTQATSSTAFAPTGTHHTVLNGSGTQNISFANPTTSFFRRLEVQAISHTVVLQTNAQVTDSLTMFPGGAAATMNGAGTSQRLTIGGLLSMGSGTASPTLTPPVVELSVTPAITGGSFSPDTTVFNASMATLPTGGGIAYKSIRINTTGAMTFFGSPSITKDLVITSGSFSVPANSTFVALGKLRISGTGVLTMTGVNGTMTVGDSAIFGGGSETGQLTAGTLKVAGNFVQTGNVSSFAPSTAHTTQFTGTGTQTISFANPTTSFFDSLVVNKGVGIPLPLLQLQSDVLVNRGMVMQNSDSLASQSAQKITIGGVLRIINSTTHPQFRPLVASLAQAPNIDSIFSVVFSPDTTVYTGTMMLPTGSTVAYKSVRVNATDTVSSPGNVTYNGDLIVSSGAYLLFSGQDSVAGFLRTEGTGGLKLGCSDCTAIIAVRDSAVFAGGSSLLTNFSTLRMRGNFVQRGAATALRAEPGATQEFAGTAAQTISFANPDSTSAGSQFGNLKITNASSGSVTLATKVFALGQLTTADTTSNRTLFGSGNDLSVRGLSGGGCLACTGGPYKLTLNNVPLVVDTSAIIGSFRDVTWTNMSASATFFWLRRAGGPAGTMTFPNLTFPSTPPNPGLYVRADQIGTGSPFVTVILTGTSPAAASNGGRTSTSGGASISWSP
jgi:hypothetical protein